MRAGLLLPRLFGLLRTRCGRDRSEDVPPHLVSCIAFAPPAVMSPCLAAACRPYVTSVVLNHDVVPRFNAHSLALLQQELQVRWLGSVLPTVFVVSKVRMEAREGRGLGYVRNAVWECGRGKVG